MEAGVEPVTRAALGLLVAAACGAQPAFRAGASETDIAPPKLPITTSGSFLVKHSEIVEGTLRARAIALDDGERRLILATADSLMIPRELIDRVKYRVETITGVPAANMLVSATHTHSAPPVMGALGTDEDPRYGLLLEERLVEAMAAAVKRLAPAKIGWASSMQWNHTHNRRWIVRPDRMKSDPFGVLSVRANMHPGHLNPDFAGPSGPVDPELSVVSLRRPDGRPLAMLANFSMHYIGVPSKVVSADYFGHFCERVRQLQYPDGGGADFVAIMTQGTSGDLHWMDYGKPKQDVDLKGYAAELAEAACAAEKGAVYRDAVKLDALRTTLTLARRIPDGRRLAWAGEIMARLGGRTPANQQEVYAREQMYLAATPARELVLQAVRIGELAITAIPNEVFAITGLKLKAQSPFARTFNIELANGAEGYIPPPEQHRLGGYTTWPARTAGLETEAEPKIVEALLTLLERLSGAKRRAPAEAGGAYASAVLASGPLAYWRGGEWQGPAAVDASGNGHHAVYEGGVAHYLEGPAGEAFSGAGVNRAPHFAGGWLKASLPRLGPVYSVEFWFWSGMPADARAVAGVLFSRGPDALRIGGRSGAQGRLVLSAGDAAAAGSTEIPMRQWRRISLVRDGAKLSVLLDGKPEVELAAPAAAPEAGLYFGGSAAGESSFEGKLDEMAVWGRALSRSEIAGRP